MNSIFERRSIRKYTHQDIPDDIVEKLLRAGMAAPSAGNEQPWHFIVIKDKSILNEIPEFHPYSQSLKEAPCAIVVCGDKQLERFKDYWVQDCSAATMNIILEAQELGLGTTWLGVYPEEDRTRELKKLLNLPEQVIPLSIVSMGYPAEGKEPVDRYMPDRVHTNKWEE